MATSSNLATTAPAPAMGHAAGRRRPAVAVARTSSSNHAATASADQDPSSGIQRRQLLSLSLLAPATATLLGNGTVALPAAADEDAARVVASSSTTLFTDPDDKFSIEVPTGWVQGSGAIGEAGTLTTNQARFSNAAGLRKVVAFLPEGKPEVSVAITIQFLGADYTGLGSFGTALDFASGVVNKMDNSYILKLPEWRRTKEGPVQVVKLLNVKDKSKQQYMFSYTLAKEDEPQRTVYQAVAVGNNGRYNRFYTVNATCTAADCGEYGPVLQRIVDSFRPPAAML